MLDYKPVYTVVELAEAAQLHRKQMHRELKRAGVQVRKGRPARVYLSELERAMPELVESIRLAAM